MMRRSILALTPSLIFLGWTCAADSTFAADAAPVPVTTVLVERRPITPSMEFVGRVEAPERVEIRARVKGALEQVLFKEGETVAAGAALYRIEKSLFEADV